MISTQKLSMYYFNQVINKSVHILNIYSFTVYVHNIHNTDSLTAYVSEVSTLLTLVTQHFVIYNRKNEWIISYNDIFINEKRLTRRSHEILF
jgi:hypothetical protein